MRCACGCVCVCVCWHAVAVGPGGTAAQLPPDAAAMSRRVVLRLCSECGPGDDERCCRCHGRHMDDGRTSILWLQDSSCRREVKSAALIATTLEISTRSYRRKPRAENVPRTRSATSEFSAQPTKARASARKVRFLPPVRGGLHALVFASVGFNGPPPHRRVPQRETRGRRGSLLSPSIVAVRCQL
jgi:hypothetical protein